MAHGHDGGHADLQQLGGDGLGRLLGLRGLAGFEEDERDAVVAQQRPEFAGEDGDVPALIELADVLRVLEAKSAEADVSVIDAVAVEVDDVIRLLGPASAFEFLAQCGKRRRAEHMDADEAAEFFHRLDQRQRAGAVIDVSARVVFRPRGDEQDADGRGHHGHIECTRPRKPAADANRLRALEKESAAVVEQLPRQAKNRGGSFASRLLFRVRRTRFQDGIDMDGEAAPGIWCHARPGLEDIRRVRRRQRSLDKGAGPIPRDSAQPCARDLGNICSAKWQTFPDTSAVPPPRSAR